MYCYWKVFGSECWREGRAWSPDIDKRQIVFESEEESFCANVARISFDYEGIMVIGYKPIDGGSPKDDTTYSLIRVDVRLNSPRHGTPAPAP